MGGGGGDTTNVTNTGLGDDQYNTLTGNQDNIGTSIDTLNTTATRETARPGGQKARARVPPRARWTTTTDTSSAPACQTLRTVQRVAILAAARVVA